MSVKFFPRNVNIDTGCDLGETDNDLDQVQGSSATLQSATTSSESYVDRLSFDIDVSAGFTRSDGTINISLDVAASADIDYRYVIRGVDLGCAESDLITGPDWSGNSIQTDVTAENVWNSSHTRLRLVIQIKRQAGKHGNKSITVNINDADTFITMNGWTAGTTSFQTVGEGTASPLGALVAVKLVLQSTGGATISPTGDQPLYSISKFPGQATATPLGALLRSISLAMGEASVAPTGALLRLTQLLLGEGTASPTGDLVAALLKIQATGGATASPAAILAAVAGKLTGQATAGPVGDLAQILVQKLGLGAAIISPSAQVLRKVLIVLGEGTISPTAVLGAVKLSIESVGGATASPLGAQLRKVSIFPGQATASPGGVLAATAGKVTGEGTASPGGVLAAKAGKLTGGAILAPSGLLLKAAGILLGLATLAPTGALGAVLLTSTPQATGGAIISPAATVATQFTAGRIVGGATVSPTGTAQFQDPDAAEGRRLVFLQAPFATEPAIPPPAPPEPGVPVVLYLSQVEDATGCAANFGTTGLPRQTMELFRGTAVKEFSLLAGFNNVWNFKIPQPGWTIKAGDWQMRLWLRGAGSVSGFPETTIAFLFAIKIYDASCVHTQDASPVWIFLGQGTQFPDPVNEYASPTVGPGIPLPELHLPAGYTIQVIVADASSGPGDPVGGWSVRYGASPNLSADSRLILPEVWPPVHAGRHTIIPVQSLRGPRLRPGRGTKTLKVVR